MALQLDKLNGACIPRAAASLSRCFSLAATECVVHVSHVLDDSAGTCRRSLQQLAEADTRLDQEAEEVGVRCSLARGGEPGPQGGRLRERQQLPHPSRRHAALWQALGILMTDDFAGALMAEVALMIGSLQDLGTSHSGIQYTIKSCSNADHDVEGGTGL